VTPFGFSGMVHGAILLYVAFSPGPAPPEPRGNIYEQMIKPEERRIVWYNLREKLPEVSAASARNDPRPPRALRKFDQTLVAGKKDDPNSTQMIYVPAPELRTTRLTPLPNVLEAAAPPPRPTRQFTPPPKKTIEAPNLPVPEAPSVNLSAESQMPVDFANPKAPLKRFTPPPDPKVHAAAKFADAPEVAAASMPNVALPPSRAPLKRFNAPADPKVRAAAKLTDAPEIAAATATANVNIGLPASRAPLRNFTPPPPVTGAAVGIESTPLPDAPVVAANADRSRLPLPLRDAHAPARLTASAPLPDAPEAAASGPSPATLAIVGLNPSKAPDFAKPTNSKSGDFSAGPDIKKTGGDGGKSDGALVVPWLTARGGGKDVQPTLVLNKPTTDPMAKENLMAAARDVGSAMPARVANAPDERLSGRAVYSIAIQMPNVTSYSGSWLVWFAEREPEPGAAPAAIRAPVPLKKVDPKYVADAERERIEGAIRLFAIIRKDGHVDSVSLLRHLDDRLDMTAQEALAKWVFDPARRNGVAIDVEAVFEIPFHLAPRSSR